MTHAPHPDPRESADRCAPTAQLRGDPLLGTAFVQARVLMVEQPGPWGPAGLRESHFDAAIAAELEERAALSGTRVQAVRRPGRTAPASRRRWALADSRAGSEVLRWGSYGADAELLDLPLDGSAGTADLERLYLVCAHSRRDPCCALRGRPVAAAIEAIRPGRVWECSHLGGHRFAANVLVLPAGLLYGRVAPLAAAEFVAAADADEVIGGLLRGRLGIAPVAQAALGFAYDQLAIRERAALRLVSVCPPTGGLASVRLAGPHGLLDVSVRIEEHTEPRLSCAKPLPDRYLSYHPLGILAVE
ncbi:MAG: sucrase ferredoxin [Actinomycetota bacterium]|nr:sucrase ferredoxin [Actinomycetota bacterium]